jgi:succinate dehydrogenase flavin-adding protein (antitoxin of CptAB toxin-antitoxin module)
MEPRLKKGYLQWRCRRGTKELDVMLNRFLDNYYSLMSDADLIEFDLFLNTQDTLLWYWLSGQQQCKNPLQHRLITKINKSIDVED